MNDSTGGAAAFGRFGSGRAVRRVEDGALLEGAGRLSGILCGAALIR